MSRLAVGLILLVVTATMARRITKKLLMKAVAAEPVLIIGGTGLMGVPTARALQELGHKVVIMSRGREDTAQGTKGRRPALPENIELLVCDREDGRAFHAALTAPTCPSIIVDFTAMAPKHIESVFAAHRARPVSHYVFISTNMVYPGGVENMDLSERASAGTPVSEDEVRYDAAAAAPENYGGNKLKCEALLSTDPLTLPSTIVRPPAVVGPGCDSRHERLHRFVANLPPMPPPERPRRPAETPGQRFRVACADDVASVIAALVAAGPTETVEVYNVASGDARGVTMDEYAVALRAAVESAGGGGEGAAGVAVEAPPGGAYEGCVPMEAVLLRNYEKQAVLSSAKAEHELGFEPTPLKDFLEQAVQWHTPLIE